jgi:cyclopropane-fatty-acyl-phospholipid synthase
LPGASAEAIQWHYDVGDEFYSLWLDPGRTYSCALWHRDDEDLSSAQRNKLDWHLEHAAARGAARLLDVGCGWGSLLRRAVEHHEVRHAVGLSLSAAQTAAIEDARMPNVEVRLESWAEHAATAPYDAIVSIGAFEHFARLDQDEAAKLDGYRRFFKFCRDVLRPGGRLSLQTITYENADRSKFSRFFAERIFPESDLPHLAEIAQAIRGSFEIEVLRNDRRHYERTLRHWLANLRGSRQAAIEAVGDATVEAYERYLALMIVGFHTGAMNLTRVAMRRVDRP